MTFLVKRSNKSKGGGMMSLLADRIEQLILKKLLEEEENVILKRNELADELDCAPSQISYVLSTRFSNDKGFIVESRRGLGGFISITRIDPDKNTYTTHYSTGNMPLIPIHAESLTKQDMTLGEPLPMTLQEVDHWLGALLYKGAIENREARFLHNAFAAIFNTVPSGVAARSIAYLYHSIMEEIRGE